MDVTITKGNVFKDLGFSDEEAVALAMRVDLALEIEKFIKRKRMTQTKAAEFFNVPQPKISKIMSSKLNGFSIDYLVKMAAKAGSIPRLSFMRKRVV